MNRIILFLIFYCSLLITEMSNSQWVYIGGSDLGGAHTLDYDSSYIYAGNSILTENYSKNRVLGVYKSSDNGNNWILTALTKPIIFLHKYNHRLFACTYHEGIYYTENYGNNWIMLDFGGDLSVLTSNDSHLFGGGISYTYSSTNNGLNWVNVLSNQSLILLKKDNLIFAANGSLIKITSNNGANWITSSVDDKPIYSLATNGSEIFAGTYNGLYKSSNNGLNWTNTMLNNYYWVVSILAFDSNLIISDYHGNGIYKSTNLGQTWMQKNEGFGSSVSIDIMIKRNGYVFASGPIGLFRRSLDDILNINIKSEIIPNNYFLSQNYPNPFNPSTFIRFSIPPNVKSQTSNVKLIVYDILGKEIATLVNEKLKPGEYEVTFDAAQYESTTLPSGIYFYSFSVDGKLIDTKKMVILK